MANIKDLNSIKYIKIPCPNHKSQAEKINGQVGTAVRVR